MSSTNSGSTSSSTSTLNSNKDSDSNSGLGATVARITGSIDDNSVSEQESNLRYAAYANRLRTILLASHRYVAYTSDIGESFRPVAHPILVKAGYAVSWLYILGDVSFAAWTTKMKSEGRYIPGLKPWDKEPEPSLLAAETFKHTHNTIDSDWKLVALKRGIFQSVASMGLPAFTIHSAVRYSSYIFKNSKVAALKTYGPVAIGLGIVPLLPYAFDEPVEHVVDWAFEKGLNVYENKGKLA
ncbi:hypothetical protein PVL30_002784 [Lodderomyces elongisporus]|uniref:uncharacterized protein n=1 Tax=Lodderomyces elongisporus TaxID=36914 RepID=UPI002921ED57|nr:uncharacterized protein PVL30_002784 [Lodderomyces elongisporus]WLF79033.1 hypothetical protein PVL30_002784 [Lodderomyces elongisporus]